MKAGLERLDTALQKRFPNLSRSLIQKLIKGGYVTISGKKATKAGVLVDESQKIELQTAVLYQDNTDIQLDILYEDENCVAVNKPVGVLTHSKGAFNPEPTVASWLRQIKAYDFPADAERGGIVHRLDRATSGVIICAKNKNTLGFLQKQFQQRKTKKLYIARLYGTPNPPHAILDLPIERNPKKPQTFRVGSNGKPSQTEYRVIRKLSEQSIVELRPITGRTHQLRVHLQYIKHPIIGDTLYGGKEAERLYLHAKQLEITIPGGIRKVFTAPEPKNFYDI